MGWSGSEALEAARLVLPCLFLHGGGYVSTNQPARAVQPVEVEGGEVRSEYGRITERQAEHEELAACRRGVAAAAAAAAAGVGRAVVVLHDLLIA